MIRDIARLERTRGKPPATERQLTAVKSAAQSIRSTITGTPLISHARLAPYHLIMDFAAYDRQYRATQDSRLLHLTQTTPQLSSTKYSHCLKRNDTPNYIIEHIISHPSQNTFLLENDVVYFGPYPSITCLGLSYVVLLGMILLTFTASSPSLVVQQTHFKITLLAMDDLIFTPSPSPSPKHTQNPIKRTLWDELETVRAIVIEYIKKTPKQTLFIIKDNVVFFTPYPGLWYMPHFAVPVEER
ncbi:hypothetical protein B0A48_11810 [Cryoendolithus antarcticus]|uniref:Uncharacterized protein n=1 Tax=Cryoendolithus antarcticus TaxID=1507870 RepID=A0A1V8SSY2_9PEZI|nr:hypothetical protein B0A48_11810 [Cryoendolithus antarcticus]